MISASAIVAGSNSGRALRTIWVTDSDSSAWRSSTISEKHSAKYGSSANCGKWTDKASASARIQSTDITSIAHHGLNNSKLMVLWSRSNVAVERVTCCVEL